MLKVKYFMTNNEIKADTSQKPDTKEAPHKDAAGNERPATDRKDETKPATEPKKT